MNIQITQLYKEDGNYLGINCYNAGQRDTTGDDTIDNWHGFRTQMWIIDK